MALTYVKLSPIEHVLQRPDSYCGSTKPRIQQEYVLIENRLEKRSVSYTPALVRCFLEILSNATDNVTRNTKDVKQTKIDVNILQSSVCVLNDGATIPIEKHKVEQIYNHTLIFGQLLTGSNYNDTQLRTTVGRNGVGAKLANIFSTVFTVEGVDQFNSLKLVQTWTDNMSNTNGPIVSKSRLKGYTKVYFEPDLKRFPGIASLPVELFSKLVFDAAMVTPDVRVTLNGQRIHSKLCNYLTFISSDSDTPVVKVLDDLPVRIWAVVSDSESGFEHISFVNGLLTRNGGRHVDAAVDAVCKPLAQKLKVTVREIKPFLRLLVVATVVNPEFEGQEKSLLEAPSVRLAPIAAITVSKLLKSINRQGQSLELLVKRVQTVKDVKTLAKTVASKSLAIEGYDKANYSGTLKSKECVLIVCEGLSAKTFAVSGIQWGFSGKNGRNYFGIYPLRGKLLNTRNATAETIGKNIVITNLIKILGLDVSDPLNFSRLNYGKLCIITDADVDGIHIECLLLNFLHCMFPTLLESGFVIGMKTPIFKIAGKCTERFYYDEYSIRLIREKSAIKYYKGLGTTKSSDVAKIFGNKLVAYTVDAGATDSFEVAFGKTKTLARKEWIASYLPAPNGLDADTTDTELSITVTQLLNQHLVKYFYEDCVRTLPSCFDGLKESQRKVLYAAFKRNLTTADIKVAQFGGYVAEHTGYHHGEVNLFGTIIKMAQSFVGSNNIPLFTEEGMFGSRLSGGEDAANSRYIFTKLSKAATQLYPDSDYYNLQECEGAAIEPAYYVPVLPMLLINGCLGIASGWMCSCPAFNPNDVIENARRALNGLKPISLIPWYKGFKGKINSLGSGRYETVGVYSERLERRKIKITELPIGMWNDKFRLECERDETIDFVKDLSTPTDPNYTLTVTDKFNLASFVKRLLTTTLNTNNIVVFDDSATIRRVSVEDVYLLWAKQRLNQYRDRKERQLKQLEESAIALNEQIQFITLVQSKVLDLTLSEQNILTTMTTNGITNKKLLNQSLRCLTSGNLEALVLQLDRINNNRIQLQATQLIDIWESDVAKLQQI